MKTSMKLLGAACAEASAAHKKQWEATRTASDQLAADLGEGFRPSDNISECPGAIRGDVYVRANHVDGSFDFEVWDSGNCIGGELSLDDARRLATARASDEI